MSWWRMSTVVLGPCHQDRSGGALPTRAGPEAVGPQNEVHLASCPAQTRTLHHHQATFLPEG